MDVDGSGSGNVLSSVQKEIGAKENHVSSGGLGEETGLVFSFLFAL